MSDESHTDTPAVVLVQGAFADGSSWSGVIERLNRRGITVTDPANPLRGIVVRLGLHRLHPPPGAPDDRGGVGHNLPQEAPQAFADAIIEVTELR